MIPRKPVGYWQKSAHAPVDRDLAFAIRAASGNGAGVCGGGIASVPSARHCYPFPSDWPGRQTVRPFFARCGRTAAGVPPAARNTFPAAGSARSTLPIPSNNRGNAPCAELSSSLPFSPRRWPAVCRILPRAGLPALRLALPYPTSRAAACLPGPLSAGWRALPPAASMWGCRPAIEPAARARAPHDLRAGQGIPGRPFSS